MYMHNMLKHIEYRLSPDITQFINFGNTLNRIGQIRANHTDTIYLHHLCFVANINFGSTSNIQLDKSETIRDKYNVLIAKIYIKYSFYRTKFKLNPIHVLKLIKDRRQIVHFNTALSIKKHNNILTLLLRSFS